jgi:hypothetical protein
MLVTTAGRIRLSVGNWVGRFGREQPSRGFRIEGQISGWPDFAFHGGHHHGYPFAGPLGGAICRTAAA